MKKNIKSITKVKKYHFTSDNDNKDNNIDIKMDNEMKKSDIILDKSSKYSDGININNNMNKIMNKNMTINDENNEEDPIKIYTNFANFIKYDMLKNAKNNTKSKILLDLACGCANDMHKWNTLFDRVIGIDNNDDQIKEGIRRYSKNKTRINTKINLYKGSIDNKNDITSIINDVKIYKYKLISNNFAINYLNLDKFFNIISNLLDNNGIFIGTFADGDVISKLGSSNEMLFTINMINEKEYTFKLETPYFKRINPVSEYIVKREDLLYYAYKYNLYPYSIVQKMNPIFNFNDYLRKYKKDTMILASLFSGFSFIKIETKFMNELRILDNMINKNLLDINNNNNNNVKLIPLKDSNPYIVIPYMDNNKYKEYLKIFIEYSKENIPNIKILIVEQVNKDKKFNRGLLCNIGIKSLLNVVTCKYVIIHDCDLLPDKELINYYYKYPINPIHIGSYGQRYSDDPYFIGGITSIRVDDFARSGGYPNDIYGWGLEDEILRDRLLYNGIVFSEASGKVKDLEDMNISEKLKNLGDTKLDADLKLQLKDKHKISTHLLGVLNQAPIMNIIRDNNGIYHIKVEV